MGCAHRRRPHRQWPRLDAQRHQRREPDRRVRQLQRHCCGDPGQPDWLNSNTALTVQALTRPDAAMLGSNHGVLAQGTMNGSDSTAGLILQYLASSGSATNVVHFKVRCTDGATYVMSAAAAHSADRQLLHGVWKQGAAPSIYLHGALSPASAADVARSGTIQIATGGLYLGAGARDPATGGWVGLIDEVR